MYMGYVERNELYQKLERMRESKLLVFVTGTRPGAETQIHSEVLPYMTEHLDRIGKAQKISLYLYTAGGDVIAAWNIVNLIRQFCDRFEVIVASKAQSAGTLLCLGADNLVMTKQATLGPIDPSVNGPLNPGVPDNTTARIPVSVESILGFIDLAREELGISDQSERTKVLLKLAEAVHPLVLGDIYRRRSQIKMLARKLMTQQSSPPERMDEIITFLVSESGSHDYTISRKEAREDLGLHVETPDDSLYGIIKGIFDDIKDDLLLTSTFSLPQASPGKQTEVVLSRALIESIDGGSDKYVTDITVRGEKTGDVSQVINFEGWKHG